MLPQNPSEEGSPSEDAVIIPLPTPATRMLTAMRTNPFMVVIMTEEGPSVYSKKLEPEEAIEVLLELDA